MSLSPDLVAAVQDFARLDRVLVATDFDGVLAPLVQDPMDSRPVDGGMPALTSLAELPGTTVALVSGRALGPLRELSGADPDGPLVLIGSHGAEDSRSESGLALDADQQELLETLGDELATLREEHPGLRVEEKPASRVVHTRGLPDDEARAALDAAQELGARHTALDVTPGKDVVELAVAHVGKGVALVALARDVDAQAVFYAGDDLTDEHGFEALADDPHTARALTVHVGDSDTSARHRVADEHEMVELLQTLLAARRG
ncbi:Trehalose-6-phosphate phosphatase [Serinicoccus hydrothermalis]|uniref:Trehalose 6-phosphate phosphatase n=1 Tax=Serinicoccus hydrothermalis TaxID=1758689 RepID=A0A1B1NF82_9MICO|nr:trehalose-phosphatase [Serinicoccus hydrothermalis]ANS80035.1 Trehalose-6-phosphate phosphatase [Serinicoccus hydrothermalis]